MSFLSNVKEAFHTYRTLRDNNVGFKDLCDVVTGKSTLVKGRVEIVDNETGEVVLKKSNLVVLRGRTFALEKMFDVPNTLDLGYNVQNLAEKKICLFKLGNGGADPTNPFTLLAGVVTPNSRALANEIPFIISDPLNDKPEKYFDLKPLDDGTGNSAYYAKTFEEMEYYVNSDTLDEVGVKLTLAIEPKDFCTTASQDENGYVVYKRSTYINELGLCIGNPTYDDTGKMTGVNNIELVTHLTFSSEPYFTEMKSSTIYYYLYA